MKVQLKVFLLVLSSISLLTAQTPYQLSFSEMTVAGTSTLHDWESDVTEVDASGKFFVSTDGIQRISSLTVTIPVEKIISGKGSIMDSKTYKALKSDAHPNIIYRLSSVDNITSTSEGVDMETTGVLTIAGVDKTIKMTVAAKLSPDGELVFQGSKALKMTDFKVKPPTAMLGAIKTGDDVTIKFKVSLSATKS